MSTLELLQDPFIALELLTVIATFVLVIKLVLMDPARFEALSRKTVSIDPRSFARMNEGSPDSLGALFAVGSLISLPKRSLAQQSHHF